MNQKKLMLVLIHSPAVRSLYGNELKLFQYNQLILKTEMGVICFHIFIISYNLKASYCEDFCTDPSFYQGHSGPYTTSLSL